MIELTGAGPFRARPARKSIILDPLAKNQVTLHTDIIVGTVTGTKPEAGRL